MKELLTLLEFLLLINLLALPVIFVDQANYDFDALARFEASIASFLLQAKASGKTIIIGINNFIISKDSTAWKSFAFFSSLMLVSIFMKENRSKQDLLYFVFSLALIFFANIIRIASTIWLSIVYGMQYFEILHLWVWRFIMLALPLGLWLFWLSKNVYYVKSRILIRVYLWKKRSKSLKLRLKRKRKKN